MCGNHFQILPRFQDNSNSMFVGIGSQTILNLTSFVEKTINIYHTNLVLLDSSYKVLTYYLTILIKCTERSFFLCGYGKKFDLG
jgi:hypothetical protein